MTDSRFDEVMKWCWSFFLLLVTVLWAIFSVLVTGRAVTGKGELDIITSSGASVLLGLLLAMLKDCNQFWFRKARDAAR